MPTLYNLDESAIRRSPQADGRNTVTWEVTGAAHSDRWVSKAIQIPSPGPLPAKLSRSQELQLRDQYDNYGQDLDPSGAACAPSPHKGSEFPRLFTLDAAVQDLSTWLTQGVRAPSAPTIQRVGPVPTSPKKKLERDPDGNALGGLRLPFINVPVAAYDGEACIEAGTTIPFTPAHLQQLYPTHATYVRMMLDATNNAVAQRYLICQDAQTVMRKASESSIGGLDKYTAVPDCAKT